MSIDLRERVNSYTTNNEISYKFTTRTSKHLNILLYTRRTPRYPTISPKFLSRPLPPPGHETTWNIP